MTDLPRPYLLPGFPFEAKARKKRRKGGPPARAVTRAAAFEDVRPFLTGVPLVGLSPSPAPPAPVPAPTQQPAPTPQPAPPPAAAEQKPDEPGADRDDSIAA